MKKLIVLGLALLLVLPALSGCTKNKTSDSPLTESPVPSDTQAESTLHSDTQNTPDTSVLSFTKDQTVLSVKISLEKSKNEQVSLLIVDGLDHKNDWSEKNEHLIDIAQVTLDDNGQATVQLHLKDENARCYLLLSTKGGSYSAKIN